MQSFVKASSTPLQRKPLRWLWQSALLALLVWIMVDLFVPTRHSIRQFDPQEVGQLETAMWRSYYEKKPVLLFWQLASGLHQQFHAPFWRSFKLGFQATKAAFEFKNGGRLRVGSERALPALVSYYESIQDISTERFDVPTVAKLELEWWIVHRQRERYSYNDLAKALAQTAAAQYNEPAARFATYGQLRADAMRLRDESSRKPGGTTQADWQRIDRELVQAWTELHKVLQ